MKNIFKSLILVSVLVIFTLKEGKTSTAYFDEFESFSFLSYNKYTILDTEKIEFIPSSPKGGICYLTLSKLSKHYFYALVVKAHEDNGGVLIDADDTFKIGLYKSNEAQIHNFYDLHLATYQRGGGYTDRLKNATTDFIYQDYDKPDFSCSLFKSKQEVLKREQNAYYFGEEYKESIILYEFSTKNELANSFIDTTGFIPISASDSFTYLVNIENPDPLSKITANLKVTDNIDGDITKNMKITTTYPKGYDLTSLSCKIYPVFISARDSFDNVASISFNIKVIDVTIPYFFSEEVLFFQSNMKYSVDYIKNNLTAYDNVDGNISNKIELVEDNYTENYNVVGEHTILFSVTDTALNTAYQEIKIVVLDATNPSIVGTDTISSTKVLLDSEILSLYKAYDNVDGDITDKIVIIENTCPGLVMGNYQIILEVSDSAGNKARKYITYIIYDNEQPVFWVSEYIHATTATPLNKNQLIRVLVDMEVVLPTDEVEINSNYFHNTNKPGEYQVSIMTTNSAGDINYKSITICVSLSDDVNVIIEPPTQGQTEEDTKETMLIGSLVVFSLLAIVLVIKKKR